MAIKSLFNERFIHHIVLKTLQRVEITRESRATIMLYQRRQHEIVCYRKQIKNKKKRSFFISRVTLSTKMSNFAL